MIGLIVTGHGQYAAGMAAAMQVIAGEQPDITYINFDDDSIDNLQQEFKSAMDTYRDAKGILVFCDLTGGTPFKTAAEMSYEANVPMKVIGGSSLPMIIETAMTRQFNTDLNELVKLALMVGKEAMAEFVLQKREPVADSEGI